MTHGPDPADYWARARPKTAATASSSGSGAPGVPGAPGTHIVSIGAMPSSSSGRILRCPLLSVPVVFSKRVTHGTTHCRRAPQVGALPRGRLALIAPDPEKSRQSEGGTARRPLSKERQVAVFRRDGWVCCWCKRPMIFAPVMKLLEREIRAAGNGDPLAYYHAHWTRHSAPLLDLLGAVIDHIEAFSAGGTEHIDNLATACNKCNGRKSADGVDKWDKRPKEKPIKGRYGEPQNWDGFSSLFVMLAQRDATTLTANERGWLRALQSA